MDLSVDEKSLRCGVERLNRQLANLLRFVEERKERFAALRYEPHTLPVADKVKLRIGQSEVPGTVGVFVADERLKLLKAGNRQALCYYPGVLMWEEIADEFSELYYCPTAIRCETLDYVEEDKVKAKKMNLQAPLKGGKGWRVQMLCIGYPTQVGAVVNSPFGTGKVANCMIEQAALDLIKQFLTPSKLHPGKQQVKASFIGIRRLDKMDGRVTNESELLLNYECFSSSEGDGTFWKLISKHDEYCDQCFSTISGQGPDLLFLCSGVDANDTPCHIGRHRACFSAHNLTWKSVDWYCGKHSVGKNYPAGVSASRSYAALLATPEPVKYPSKADHRPAALPSSRKRLLPSSRTYVNCVGATPPPKAPTSSTCSTSSTFSTSSTSSNAAPTAFAFKVAPPQASASSASFASSSSSSSSSWRPPISTWSALTATPVSLPLHRPSSPLPRPSFVAPSSISALLDQSARPAAVPHRYFASLSLEDQARSSSVASTVVLAAQLSKSTSAPSPPVAAVPPASALGLPKSKSAPSPSAAAVPETITCPQMKLLLDSRPFAFEDEFDEWDNDDTREDVKPLGKPQQNHASDLEESDEDDEDEDVDADDEGDDEKALIPEFGKRGKYHLSWKTTGEPNPQPKTKALIQKVREVWKQFQPEIQKRCLRATWHLLPKHYNEDKETNKIDKLIEDHGVVAGCCGGKNGNSQTFFTPATMLMATLSFRMKFDFDKGKIKQEVLSTVKRHVQLALDQGGAQPTFPFSKGWLCLVCYVLAVDVSRTVVYSLHGGHVSTVSRGKTQTFAYQVRNLLKLLVERDGMWLPNKESKVSKLTGKLVNVCVLPFYRHEQCLKALRELHDLRKVLSDELQWITRQTYRRALDLLEKEPPYLAVEVKPAKGLAACSKCVELQDNIRRARIAINNRPTDSFSAMLQRKLDDANHDMDEHTAEFQEQREYFLAKKKKALKAPHLLMTATLDGMDQNKSCLPGLVRPLKEAPGTLKVRVVGAIVFGGSPVAVGLTSFDDVPSKGGNAAVTAMERIIDLQWNAMDVDNMADIDGYTPSEKCVKDARKAKQEALEAAKAAKLQFIHAADSPDPYDPHPMKAPSAAAAASFLPVAAPLPASRAAPVHSSASSTSSASSVVSKGTKGTKGTKNAKEPKESKESKESMRIDYSETDSEDERSNGFHPAKERRKQRLREKLPFLWPEGMHWTFDNTTGDSKNACTFRFFGALVMLGVFSYISISNLLVGHTHDIVDQMFSVWSRHLKGSDVWTLRQMHSDFRHKYGSRIYALSDDIRKMRSSPKVDPSECPEVHPRLQQLATDLGDVRPEMLQQEFVIDADRWLNSEPIEYLSAGYCFLIVKEEVKPLDGVKNVEPRKAVDGADGVEAVDGVEAGKAVKRFEVVLYSRHMAKSHENLTVNHKFMVRDERWTSRYVLTTEATAPNSKADPLKVPPLKMDELNLKQVRDSIEYINQFTPMDKENTTKARYRNWCKLLDRFHHNNTAPNPCAKCAEYLKDIGKIGVIKHSDVDCSKKTTARTNLRKDLSEHIDQDREGHKHLLAEGWWTKWEQRVAQVIRPYYLWRDLVREEDLTDLLRPLGRNSHPMFLPGSGPLMGRRVDLERLEAMGTPQVGQFIVCRGADIGLPFWVGQVVMDDKEYTIEQQQQEQAKKGNKKKRSSPAEPSCAAAAASAAVAVPPAKVAKSGGRRSAKDDIRVEDLLRKYHIKWFRHVEPSKQEIKKIKKQFGFLAVPGSEGQPTSEATPWVREAMQKFKGKDLEVFKEALTWWTHKEPEFRVLPQPLVDQFQKRQYDFRLNEKDVATEIVQTQLIMWGTKDQLFKGDDKIWDKQWKKIKEDLCEISEGKHEYGGAAAAADT